MPTLSSAAAPAAASSTSTDAEVKRLQTEISSALRKMNASTAENTKLKLQHQEELKERDQRAEDYRYEALGDIRV